MKDLIKNALLLSVYHVAKGTVANIEETMKKEDEDKDKKELKRHLLVVSTVHSLLGILYND